jgi:hypothetical protein
MTSDPLLLGQRVIAILEQGQRAARHKAPRLMALINDSIENQPSHANGSLTVPIPELAHLVLALCWHQVGEFEGYDLFQRRPATKRRITDTGKGLGEASRVGFPVGVARQSMQSHANLVRSPRITNKCPADATVASSGRPWKLVARRTTRNRSQRSTAIRVRTCTELVIDRSGIPDAPAKSGRSSHCFHWKRI